MLYTSNLLEMIIENFELPVLYKSVDPLNQPHRSCYKISTFSLTFIEVLRFFLDMAVIVQMTKLRVIRKNSRTILEVVKFTTILTGPVVTIP